MKTLHCLFMGIIILIPISFFAQGADTNQIAKTQVTFAYPVGSNGMEAVNISNNLSFNILYGVNGPLDGFELGSIVNVINGNVKGCQISGIANVVDGSVTGGQISGIANIIADSLYGLQFAGVVNMVPRNMLGGQFAGIYNLTNQSLIGAQIAGISNVTNGKVHGAQIAGIHNLAVDSLTGAQIAGIYNQSLQITYGAQIGLINSTKVLQGAQIGLINVADSSNGISIGLINIVKNGYHGLELYGNEVMYFNAAIKTGTDAFYNIYTAGFQPDSVNKYGFGIGFGSKIKLINWLSMSADLTTNYIQETKKVDWKVNFLNRADVTFDFSITKNISILLGPSFNAHISELGYENTGGFTTDIAVNPFYTESEEGYQLQMWVGAKGGFRFTF